jgi:hypothetical protein
MSQVMAPKFRAVTLIGCTALAAYSYSYEQQHRYYHLHIYSWPKSGGH